MHGITFLQTVLLREAVGRRLAPPRLIPSFKPVPFKQEKFLSIKSRTAEKYFNARNQILQRSATITEQVWELQKQQQKEQRSEWSGEGGKKGDDCTRSDSSGNSGGNKCCERVSIGAPLTAHMAEEIDSWNRNMKDLEAHQGFVLTDELVYEAVSKNIQLGAFPYVLEWLQKAAQEQRIPIPVNVLHDLRLLIDFVQSVLPTSNVSMIVPIDTFLRMEAPACQRFETDISMEPSPRLVNTSPYVRYLFTEIYIPVWNSLLQLGLLPPLGKEESEWWHQMQEPQQTDCVMDLMGRVCCSSSSAGCSDDDGNTGTLKPLQAFTELFLALAQCAAEAKEIHILTQLQLMFCTLFVERGDSAQGSSSTTPDVTAAASSVCKLKRDPWCHSAADKELLYSFANNFVSVIFYGRQAYESEVTLGRYICCPFDASEVRDGNSTSCEAEKQDEVEEASPPTSSQVPPPPSKGDHEEGETVGVITEVSSPETTLQVALDEILKDLLVNESPALADASIYIALALQDSSLLQHSASNCRFSQVELDWIRVHCDISRRCQKGEDTFTELEHLFLPGGMAARGLEATSVSSIDRQCFVALTVETVVAIAASTAVPVAKRRTGAARVIAELLLRLEEAQKGEQHHQQQLVPLLPLFSAASAAVLLSPLFDLRDSSCGGCDEREKEDEAERKGDLVICRKDATRLLQAVLSSVLNHRDTDFGNAYSTFLLVLVKAELWEEILLVLRKLDEVRDGDSMQHGISSVLVDQRVWAWVFRKARDAGQVDLCLFLRGRREKLFY